MKTVEVAIIFDGPWAPLSGVMAASMLAHANPQRNYILHVFQQGSSADDLARFRSLARRNFEVRIHDEQLVSKNRVNPDLGKGIAFEKLRLAEMLPGTKKLAYLDTDLVLMHDVADLYDIDLGGAPMGAIIDPHFQRNTWREGRRVPPHIYDGTFREYLTAVVGLPPDAHNLYFNSGVMLLDLETMRAEGTAEKARQAVAVLQRPLIGRDQCLLNRYFAQRMKPLDLRWNTLAPVSRLRLWLNGDEHSRSQLASLRDPYALHFAGHKPWRHHVRPLAGKWWAYALASPFAGKMLAEYRRSMRTTKLSRVVPSLLLTPFQIALSLPRYLMARRRLAQG